MASIDKTAQPYPNLPCIFTNFGLRRGGILYFQRFFKSAKAPAPQRLGSFVHIFGRGSYYEQLSHDEKFWLLAQLSRQLWVDFADSSNVREGVIVAANRLQAEIPPDLRMGMIQALCDQIKS